MTKTASAVTIVPDYLLEGGGAERVALEMRRAIPEASILTSLFDPAGTFPEFSELNVQTIRGLNRIRFLRNHHRMAAPVLGPAYRRTRVESEVCLCSSSGWSHLIGSTGRKVVYCHNPPGWIYRADQFREELGPVMGGLSHLLVPYLRRHDQRAANEADVYVVNSSEVRQRVRDNYGREAEILHPPPGIVPDGTASPLALDPGFYLVVSRLLVYKHVDVAVRAAVASGRRLVVAGIGPDYERLQSMAGPGVTIAGRVDDSQLRWLYRNCAGLIAPAHEDFGLTPVEANGFGRPVIALRWGGYLDSVIEGETGVFFEAPTPDELVGALERFEVQAWDESAIRAHAATFSSQRFGERLRQICGLAPLPAPADPK